MGRPHKNDIAIEHDWKPRAACRGLPTNLFFSDLPAAQKKAAAICGECEVQKECADYAYTLKTRFRRSLDENPQSELWQVYNNELYGVWGGKLYSENIPRHLGQNCQALLRRMRQEANAEGVWEGSGADRRRIIEDLGIAKSTLSIYLLQLREDGYLRDIPTERPRKNNLGDCHFAYQVCDTLDAPIPTTERTTLRSKIHQWLLSQCDTNGIWEGNAADIAKAMKTSDGAIRMHFHFLKKAGKIETIGLAKTWHAGRKYRIFQ